MRTSTKLKLAGKGVKGIADAGYETGKVVGHAQADGRGRRASAIAGAVGGASLVYFFDPQAGRERRRLARERISTRLNG